MGDGGTVLHYDGAGWTEMASPTSEDLYDVWGSGPSDVFAVGDSGTVLHHDGTVWSPVRLGTSANFRGVWSTSTVTFVVGHSD